MTVTFAEVDDASTLDETLKPLLARASRTSAPDATSLAAIARGISLGFKPAEIRASLRRLDRQGGSSISSPRWYRLVSHARKTAVASSSPAGAAEVRLRIARRVVARLLNPVVPEGIGPRAEVSLRIAFGAVGAVFLRESATRGYDSIICTSSYLAAQLGVTPRQATRQLKALRGLGWIVSTTKARGGALRWRLPRLSHDEGQLAYRFGAAVDGLASGEPDRLGDAILTALHPAFHYGAGGELDSRAWLALVAHRGRLGSLGLSRTLVRRAQKAIETHLPGAWEEGDTNLASSLDAYALSSGSLTRKTSAEVVLSQAAAAHRAQLADLMQRRTEEKELRAQARAVLKKAWGAVGGVPGADAGEAALQAWAAATRELLVAHPLSCELASTVPSTLTGQLVWRGYAPEVAARITAFIFSPQGT